MNVMKQLLTVCSVYMFAACTDSGKPEIESEEIIPPVNEVPTLIVLAPEDGASLWSDSLVNVSLQVQDAEACSTWTNVHSSKENAG